MSRKFRYICPVNKFEKLDIRYQGFNRKIDNHPVRIALVIIDYMYDVFALDEDCDLQSLQSFLDNVGGKILDVYSIEKVSAEI